MINSNDSDHYLISSEGRDGFNKSQLKTFAMHQFKLSKRITQWSTHRIKIENVLRVDFRYKNESIYCDFVLGFGCFSRTTRLYIQSTCKWFEPIAFTSSIKFLIACKFKGLDFFVIDYLLVGYRKLEPIFC